jgi:transketolase
MPSFELFDQQEEAYRNQVLPPSVRHRVAVEAGSTTGWERYVGDGGLSVGIDRFGVSAPAGRIAEEFGFRPDALTATIQEYLRS